MASQEAHDAQQEAEVARQATAAFGRAFTEGDVDGLLAFLASDVSFEVPSVMQETVMKLKGHDEVRSYLEQTASEYDELIVESREVTDCGEGRYLMSGSWHATVRKTKTRFGTPMGAVLDLSDGRVTRLRAFFDEQLAMNAARPRLAAIPQIAGDDRAAGQRAPRELRALLVLRQRLDAKALEQRPEVGLDRGHREAQLRRDLLVGSGPRERVTPPAEGRHRAIRTRCWDGRDLHHRPLAVGHGDPSLVLRRLSEHQHRLAHAQLVVVAQPAPPNTRSLLRWVPLRESPSSTSSHSPATCRNSACRAET